MTVADLSEEQKGQFGDFVEFWDSSSDAFYEEADPAGIDPAHITEALRITFHGWYDEEEDDFEGRTFFSRSLAEDERPEQFSRRHKQVCGFLYLRSHRTGSRALSLERGSLKCALPKRTVPTLCRSLRARDDAVRAVGAGRRRRPLTQRGSLPPGTNVITVAGDERNGERKYR